MKLPQAWLRGMTVTLRASRAGWSTPHRERSLSRRLADRGGDVTEGHLKCLSPLSVPRSRLLTWTRSAGTALKGDASLLPADRVVEPSLRLLANPHLLLDLVERAEEEHARRHAHVRVDAGLGLVQVVSVPVKPAEGLHWQPQVEKLVLAAGAICHSSSPSHAGASGASSGHCALAGLSARSHCRRRSAAAVCSGYLGSETTGCRARTVCLTLWIACSASS